MAPETLNCFELSTLDVAILLLITIQIHINDHNLINGNPTIQSELNHSLQWC